MEFLVSAQTDIGISKSTNQDSLLVRIANTAQGRISFAVLCDGMGGLSKGEVASATVIRAFDNWFNRDFQVFVMPRSKILSYILNGAV